MRYPRCQSVAELRQLPVGSEVYLPGWSLTKYAAGYWTGDGSSLIEIRDLPADICAKISFPGDIVFGLEVHVRLCIEEQDPLNIYWTGTKRFVQFFEPPKPKCDCGAVHSFLPNHHMPYCSMVQQM